MTHPALHDRLTAFVLNLNLLTPTAQRDAFVNEVIETGGIYGIPPISDGFPLIFEVCLHGIQASAATERDAVSAWIAKAKAAIPLDPADQRTDRDAHVISPHISDRIDP